MTSGLPTSGSIRGAAGVRPAVTARAGLAVLLGAGLCLPAAVRAEEPLYLRIRSHPAARLDGAAGPGPAAGPDAEGPPRETVWERSDRRARIAIASVCTGCLPAPSSPRASKPASVAEAPASDPRSSLLPPSLPTEGVP